MSPFIVPATLPRTARVGLVLAAVTAAISGVSVFINGLIVTSFPDPVALAAVRNGLVGLAIVAWLGLPSLVAELRALDGRRRTGLVVLGILGGGVPFILFFSGLGATGGAGAAVLQKSMFLWVALLAVPLLGERVGMLQIAALGALAVGSLLAGPMPATGIGMATALVLVATWLWAGEVVLARRLLAGVSVRLAAAARMTIGAGVIVAWLVLSGRGAAITSFGATQWPLIALTGLLLFGYVTTWYGALARTTATNVSSILVGGAVVTAALTAIRVGTVPAAPVVTGLVLIVTGSAVVWLAGRRSAAGTEPGA
jgi:drug/metabolite transporter (DMT)-like permease